MKNKLLAIFSFLIILFVVISSYMNKQSVFEANINNNESLKEANIVEYKDIENPLMDELDDGYKKVNMYIDGNTISFDKSNTVTELDYNVINKINNSDKTTWNIITNNFVENYEYINNKIVIDDKNVEKLTFSFVYNDVEYDLAVVKDGDINILKEAKVKLIHGNMNSLWYQYFYDLNDAIKAARPKDIIILYDDMEVNNTINVDKSISIIADNKHTLKSNSKYLFNITKNNVTLDLTNITLDTNSFVKGKYNKNVITVNNSKILYKNKMYSKKKFNKVIKQDNKKSFIKTSL
jgi:hypothetical protein